MTKLRLRPFHTNVILIFESLQKFVVIHLGLADEMIKHISLSNLNEWLLQDGFKRRPSRLGCEPIQNSSEADTK